MRGLAALAVGLGLLAGPARAQVAQVWQGTAFITGVTSTCVSGNDVAVGDDYVIVYRPIIAGSAANGTTKDEGLSFHGVRNAVHYFTQVGVKFGTGSNAYLVVLGSRATASLVANTSVAPTIPVSLHISPTPIALTTPTVTITGTLNSFFDAPGCNVAFTAALDRRNN